MEDMKLVQKSELLSLEIETEELRNKVQYLKNLEHDLKEFDQIFLVFDEEKRIPSILPVFCDAVVRQKKKKILVLSPISIKKHSGHSFIYRKISEDEALHLYRLYHMYEFSDRFSVLSLNKMFGGLFNFLNVGMLNLEEVFMALLD